MRIVLGAPVWALTHLETSSRVMSVSEGAADGVGVDACGGDLAVLAPGAFLDAGEVVDVVGDLLAEGTGSFPGDGVGGVQ